MPFHGPAPRRATARSRVAGASAPTECTPSSSTNPAIRRSIEAPSSPYADGADGTGSSSDRHPGAELDGAVRRNVEIVGDASGVARERRKDEVTPARNPALACTGHDLLTRQEEARLHRIDREARRGAEFEGVRDVGSLHESVACPYPPAVAGDAFGVDASEIGDPRHAAKLGGEEHVLLVEHLVVLEAVEQRVGRDVGTRREEDRGSRHARRWIGEERADEAVERRRSAGNARGE